jgi:hypothetical protein
MLEQATAVTAELEQTLILLGQQQPLQVYLDITLAVAVAVLI